MICESKLSVSQDGLLLFSRSTQFLQTRSLFWEGEAILTPSPFIKFRVDVTSCHTGYFVPVRITNAYTIVAPKLYIYYSYTNFDWLYRLYITLNISILI
jgi:hypothetical protein